MFRIVIPARYASTRLPGKPLRVLAGKPLIQWVYERASRAGAAEVLIATDDGRIAEVARGFGAEVLMTSADHASGTDRIAEVARARGWAPADIVVNVQGDEPLMPEALIAQVAALLAAHPGADMATLAAPLEDRSALEDPQVVKVVQDLRGRALYFSRAPIPWERDARAGATVHGALRHIGLYAYRVGAILRLAALAPTRLEELERLEQLRALEHGFEIRLAEAIAPPGIDVNVPADLARAAAALST